MSLRGWMKIMGKPGRPGLEPGTWGCVRFYETASGRVSARSRYRDHDGVIHNKRATANTREDAERKLKASVLVSARGDLRLTRESTIGDLGRWWLAGLHVVGGLHERTLANYEYDRRAVEAAFSAIRLSELTTRVADSVIAGIAVVDRRRAKRVHRTLGVMCDEALRIGMIDENPIDRVRAPRVERRPPYALTSQQAAAVRGELRDWLEDDSRPGPRPDQRVAIMLDLMLATSARIGEALALRVCDVDLWASPPQALDWSHSCRGCEGGASLATASEGPTAAALHCVVGRNCGSASAAGGRAR